MLCIEAVDVTLVAGDLGGGERQRIPAVVLGAALDPALLDRVCIFEQWELVVSRASDDGGNESDGGGGDDGEETRAGGVFLHFEICMLNALEAAARPSSRPAPTPFVELDAGLSRQRRRKAAAAAAPSRAPLPPPEQGIDIVGRVVAVTPILDITKGMKHLFFIELAEEEATEEEEEEAAAQPGSAAPPLPPPLAVTVFFRGAQMRWHPFFSVARPAPAEHWVWRITAVRAREIKHGSAKVRVLVATDATMVHRTRSQLLLPPRTTALPHAPASRTTTQRMEYTGTLTACVGHYIWQLDNMPLLLIFTHAHNVRRANGAGSGSGGLSAAMRVGAIVRVVGAVPVYSAHEWGATAFRSIIAIGATLRTQVQLVSFSPYPLSPAPPSALRSLQRPEVVAQQRRLQLMLGKMPLPVVEWALRAMAAIATKFAMRGVSAEHQRGIVRELLRPSVSPAYVAWLARSGWRRDVYAEAMPQLGGASCPSSHVPLLTAPLWSIPTLRELEEAGPSPTTQHPSPQPLSNAAAAAAAAAVTGRKRLYASALAVGWLECSDDGLRVFLRDDTAALRVELANLLPEHFLLCRSMRVAPHAAADGEAGGARGEEENGDGTDDESEMLDGTSKKAVDFSRGAFHADPNAPSPRELRDGAGGEGGGDGVVSSHFVTDALPAAPLSRASRSCCCRGSDSGSSGSTACGFGQHFWALSCFTLVRTNAESVLIGDMRNAVCLGASSVAAAAEETTEETTGKKERHTLDVRVVRKPAAAWSRIANELQCTVEGQLLNESGGSSSSAPPRTVQLIFRGASFSRMYRCMEEGETYRIFDVRRVEAAPRSRRSAAGRGPSPLPFAYPADLSPMSMAHYHVSGTTVVRRLAQNLRCDDSCSAVHLSSTRAALCSRVIPLRSALVHWTGGGSRPGSRSSAAAAAAAAAATPQTSLSITLAKLPCVSFRACVVARRVDSVKAAASSSSSSSSSSGSGAACPHAYLGVGDATKKLTLTIRDVFKCDGEWALGVDTAEVYVDMKRCLCPTSALQLGSVATFFRFARCTNAKGTNIFFRSELKRGCRIRVDAPPLALLCSPAAAAEQVIVVGSAAAAAVRSLRPTHSARCWLRIALRTVASLVAEPTSLLSRAVLRLRCSIVRVAWFQVVPLDTVADAARASRSTAGACAESRGPTAVRCSGRCEWKCTVVVDDGTGQAKLSASGDLAVQLLGCDAREVRWIEELAPAYRAKGYESSRSDRGSGRGDRGGRGGAASGRRPKGLAFSASEAAALRGCYLAREGQPAMGGLRDLFELVAWGFVHRAKPCHVCCRRYVMGGDGGGKSAPRWEISLCGASVATERHRSVTLDLLHVAPFNALREAKRALAARQVAVGNGGADGSANR